MSLADVEVGFGASGLLEGHEHVQNFEIKAKLTDRRRVERQLSALGARRMWLRAQRDTFFVLPPQASGSTWLKLREVDGRRAELISYRREGVADAAATGAPLVSDYDVMVVEDPGAWKRLLGRVLPLDRVVEKERTLWLYENTRVHLDDVVGLGPFVELETVVQGQSAADARQETLRLMDVLHVEREACVRGAYRDLLS